MIRKILKTSLSLWRPLNNSSKPSWNSSSRANNLADAGRARWEPVPYLSALVDGCLQNGKDCNAGGARYNFLTVEGVALATVADSLAAVKKTDL